MLPLIDVLIPAYNAEKYISRCLKSVASQTYKNLRILIVNDGSTDNTLSIVNEFCKNEPRAQVIDQSNKGIGATRNLCLDNLKGDYFYFLDSDDYISENAIELLFNKITAYNSDVAIGERVSNSGPQLTSTINVDNISITDIQSFFDDYVFNNRLYYVVTGKLYSRKAIGTLRFDTKYNFAEDLLFNLCFYTNASSISIDSNSLYYYEDNIDSLTRTKKADRCYQQYNVCECFYKYLCSINRQNELEFIISELHWMCVISGLTLSKREDASKLQLIDFAKYTNTCDLYKQINKTTLKKAAKHWISIESKSFLSAMKLKITIYLILGKHYKALSYIL